MRKSVLYIKKFENGGVYIGITCNFLRRMGKHRYDAKHGSKLPVHRAMMKYKYEDEILCESKDREYICRMEQAAISNFRDLGYKVYNVLDGGDGGISTYRNNLNEEELHELNDAVRERIKKYIEKSVHVYDYDGNYVSEYRSVSLAAEALGVKQVSISECLWDRDRDTSTGGYRFSFNKYKTLPKTKKYFGNKAIVYISNPEYKTIDTIELEYLKDKYVKYEDTKTIKYISPNSKVLCKTLNEARDTLRKWKYMIFKNNSYILVDKLNLNFGITYREYVNLKVKSRVKNGEEVCIGCYKIREIKAK